MRKKRREGGAFYLYERLYWIARNRKGEKKAQYLQLSCISRYKGGIHAVTPIPHSVGLRPLGPIQKTYIFLDTWKLSMNQEIDAGQRSVLRVENLGIKPAIFAYSNTDKTSLHKDIKKAIIPHFK
ncbi:MAG: hypothetical protein JXJ04_20120 [Spirochaetales bacterium]|nr:hypothetical protein [Spirochaetales bacterium]